MLFSAAAGDYIIRWNVDQLLANRGAHQAVGFQAFSVPTVFVNHCVKIYGNDRRMYGGSIIECWQTISLLFIDAVALAEIEMLHTSKCMWGTRALFVYAPSTWIGSDDFGTLAAN